MPPKQRPSRESEMRKGNDDKSDPKQDKTGSVDCYGKNSAIATNPKILFVAACVVVFGILVALVAYLVWQKSTFVERIQELDRNQTELLNRMQKLEESIKHDCKVECLDGEAVLNIVASMKERIAEEKRLLNEQFNKRFDKMEGSLESFRLSDSMTSHTQHDIEKMTEFGKQLESLQKNISEVKIFTTEEMEKLQGKLNTNEQKLEESVETINNISKQSQEMQEQLEEFKSNLPGTGNTKHFNKNITATELLDTLQHKTEELTDGLGKLNTTVLDMNGTLCNMNVTLTNTTDGLGKLNTTVLDINGTLFNMNVTLTNTTDGLGKLNTTVLDVNVTLCIMNVTLTNTTDGLGKLNTTVLDVNVTLFNMNVTLTNTTDGLGKLNTTVLDINSTLRNMNVTLTNTTDGLGKLNTTVLDINITLWNMNVTLTNTTDRLGKLNTTVLDINGTLFNMNKTLSNRTSALETANKSMNISLRDVNSTVNEVIAKADISEGEIKNIKEKSDFFKEVIMDKVDRTREKVENVERDNISFGMYLVLIVVAMVTGVFLIVNWVHIKFRDGQSLFNRMTSKPGSSQSTTVSQPLRSVLDSIGRKQLSNKLCILSFYAETQNLHKRLTDSACQGLGVLQEQYLLGKHEHIPNIPPCRIVLVFVDFNERDIILENPKREVGDLKLTTVKGARKMGCDVFVIYVRDKGSRTLADGHLFNPNLMSVYEHEELSDLNERKRVMSTYDSFTQYQVRHLHDCFRRLR